MGRKSSAKAHAAPPPPPEPKRSSSLPLVAALVALIAVGSGFAYWRSVRAQPDVADAGSLALPPDQIAADVAATAKFGPHHQDTLPPLDLPGYALPRSPEVIRAAYKFAAEHPEILSYVPCFCGCERSGHKGNHDCFVRARAVNGDVIEWDPHGMECTVCIDVATRSMQMYASGASVTDIRSAIEKDWAARSTTHTPTPPPPHQH